MRQLPILLFSLCISCISIGRKDLTLLELEKPVPDQSLHREIDGFWDAIKHLDYETALDQAQTEEQLQLNSAVQSMINADYSAAANTLEELIESSSDSVLVSQSVKLLVGIYKLDFNWDGLIQLNDKLPGDIDDMNTIELVKAWDKANPESIIYPESPLILPIEKSISGVPVVDVLVNGVPYSFWIDTGAEFTVLSSDITQECGVEPLTTVSSEVSTATDHKVRLAPGVIKELRIDDLVFNNHPVFIIGKEDLEFYIFKIFRIFKIDGILGWNAIQNLHLDIDYQQEKIIISKPGFRASGDRNFHFLTQPFITVTDTIGTPLQFFLDTGANNTSIYTSAYAFFDTSSAEISHAKVGGAGGWQNVKQLKFKNQSIVLGSLRINFPTIQGQKPLGDAEEGFILYDGILGSDVAQDGRFILDFQNGYFDIIPGTTE